MQAASSEKQHAISPLVRRTWACPSCKDPGLVEQEAIVRCTSCDRRFGTHRGIPLFCCEEPPPPELRFAYDLTIMVLALNERENVRTLTQALREHLDLQGIRYQLLLLDGGSTDGTPEAARELGVQVHVQERRGYGGALAEGFALAEGRHVLTMDADLSHPARFVDQLWQARGQADLLVASRYVPGARFDAPLFRKVLSRILNYTFTRALSIPVRDIASGFRLYDGRALREISIEGTNFEALEEILIKVFSRGWSVGEVPFHYEPRREGRSKVRLVNFGLCFLRTFWSMWALRNSIESADYDDRAFDSRIPLQRYWQRRRHRAVLGWMRRCEGAVLDVGCGSSRIIKDLPQAIGVDVALSKLRYLRSSCEALAQGSIFELPFAERAFDGVICSQVVEHVPAGDLPFQELARVSKPGALLVVGTPDYGRPYWPFIESVYKRVHPQGYADEHITHYTLPSLVAHLERAGFEILDRDYILGAELNVLARRRGP